MGDNKLCIKRFVIGFNHSRLVSGIAKHCSLLICSVMHQQIKLRKRKKKSTGMKYNTQSLKYLIMFMGNRNTKAGANKTNCDRAMGSQGCGQINDNGSRLVDFGLDNN